MLALVLIVLSGTPADALAEPTFSPKLKLTTTPRPADTAPPATIPFVPRPDPVTPPAQPAAPKAPQAYQMYSSRYRTWFTHTDPRWLETYVRGLDGARPNYSTTACPTGTCPR